MIDINVDDINKKLKHLQKGLAGFEVKLAQSRALNRTIVAARTATSKQVRGKYKIRAKDIKKTISTRKASPQRQTAAMHSVGAPINLIAFSPRITKKGVTARIKGQSKAFPGAFKAKMKSGHVGIFARAQYKNNKLQTRRARHTPSNENDLQITEIKTLSVPSAIANKTISGNLRELIRTSYPKTLEAELNFRKLKAAGLIPGRS